MEEKNSEYEIKCECGCNGKDEFLEKLCQNPWLTIIFQTIKL